MLKTFLTFSIASVFAINSSYTLAEQNLATPELQQNEVLAPLVTASADTALSDQYIVVLKQPMTLSNDPIALQQFTEQTVSGLATQHSFEIEKVFNRSLSGFVATLSAEQLFQLRSDQQVEFIEQNQVITLDPIFSTNANQSNAIWGLDRIDQRDRPLNSNYSYNYDGSGVTAYVIDTGVTNTHPEFSGRSSSGYDFVDNDSDATDCNGHGTHVAGTIGGAQYGVAKNVNIVGVRVLSCTGSGTTAGVISGVDWVAANASGPSVAT